MCLLLDLLFLLLLGVLTALAARRGFFASVLHLAAWVLSLALAAVLSRALAAPVYSQFVQPWVVQQLATYLPTLPPAALTFNAALLPQAVLQALAFAHVDLDQLDVSILLDPHATAATAQQLEAALAPYLTQAVHALLSALAFALCFAAARVAVALLLQFKELPVLKQADTLLGGALGFVRGLLLVFVLALVLRAVAATPLAGTAFVRQCEQSFALRLLGYAWPATPFAPTPTTTLVP